MRGQNIAAGQERSLLSHPAIAAISGVNRGFSGYWNSMRSEREWGRELDLVPVMMEIPRSLRQFGSGDG